VEGSVHVRADGCDHPRGGSRTGIDGSQVVTGSVSRRSTPCVSASAALKRATFTRCASLEARTRCCKNLVAERDLGIEVMKEVATKKLVSVPARRRQVAYGRERALSVRRGCTLFAVMRSALCYESRKAEEYLSLNGCRRWRRNIRAMAIGTFASFWIATHTG
jgi:hypothetical protein